MRFVAVGRRLSVGVLDQALSSGSNFAAIVVAGRYLSSDDFGAFSIAIVCYTLALGLCRAVCTEALLVRPGEVEDGSRERSASGAVGAALTVGFASMATLLLAAPLLDAPLSKCLVVVAVCLPLLLVQDAIRHVFFSRQTPVHALASDLGWVTFQFAGIGALIATDNVTAPNLVPVWMASGALAGLTHMTISGIRPRLAEGRRWISRNRDLSLPYALNFLTSQGSGHLSSLILAGVAGAAATGSVRGAMALFGPITVVYTGVYVVIVPEARRLVSAPRRLLRTCAATSLTMGVLVAVVAGVLLSIPESVGEALLGSTWSSSHPLIPYLGILSIMSAVASGAIIGLTTLAEARAILRSRIMTVPTTLGLPVLGAVTADARGMVIGLGAATAITAVVYWLTLMRIVDSRSSQVADDVEAEPAAGARFADGP